MHGLEGQWLIAIVCSATKLFGSKNEGIQEDPLSIEHCLKHGLRVLNHCLPLTSSGSRRREQTCVNVFLHYWRTMISKQRLPMAPVMLERFGCDFRRLRGSSRRHSNDP